MPLYVRRLDDNQCHCFFGFAGSGFAAYDTQHIKNTLMYDDEDLNKKEILGALNLYLDFVNLFLNLLDLLGVKKRND